MQQADQPQQRWPLSLEFKPKNVRLKPKMLFPNCSFSRFSRKLIKKKQIQIKLKTQPQVSVPKKSKSIKSKIVGILKKLRIMLKLTKNKGISDERITGLESLDYEGPNGESIALFYQSIAEDKIKGMITLSLSILLYHFPKLNNILENYMSLLIWSIAMGMSYLVTTILQNCFIDRQA